MLDTFEQSQGLLHGVPAAPIRLLVVPATAHGGMAHQLLWLLARRLTREGELVLVIDGMADEPSGGWLLARLQQPGRQSVGWPIEWPEDGVAGVHILPGRQGLLQLGNQAQAHARGGSVDRLAAVVPDGAFVLLTAPVEVLAVVLQAAAVRPLVPFNGQPRSLVEAYNAIKVLVQAGDMRPVLVPMAPASRHAADTGLATLDAPAQALVQCAQAHLGVDVPRWPVAYDEKGSASGDRVSESWWYKVLDSALAVPPHSPPLMGPDSTPGPHGGALTETDFRRC